ncbi:MAG TPA: transferrin-binding protein-like solute binding protein [Campylobacterales bacterium]|nr:transferrin-binding protein-like solute binding protein [Campylobacterales bacterium]
MKTKFILPLLLILQTLLFASVGKITAVNGDVSVVRATKTIKATSGFTLEEKDGIKSSKGSSAQIVFNDKTVITVGSDTLFKVEEYSSDAASPKARFGVGEGTFKAVTGKIGKIAPDKFKIETKTATIGIRGTTLAGRVLPSGETLVMCMRGAITVSPNIPNPPMPVVVKEGEITQAGTSGVEPPRKLTPNDMKNLQGGLAPLAKNTTPNNNNGDDNGGGTTTQQPTQQTTQQQTTSTPNLDSVKELTSKAVDNLVNDKVAQNSVKSWAESYSAGGYISGSNYLVSGWKSEFSFLNDAPQSSTSFGSDVELNLNVLTKTVTSSGGLLNSPVHSHFSIASEDSFSFIASGTVYDSIAYNYVPAVAAIVSIDDSAGADYVSWGYWTTAYTNGNSDSVSEFGTWVGGAMTAIADMPTSGTATYKGNVIGGVVGGTGPSPEYSPILMNGFNSATFNIDFGSNKSVSGNLSFNTASGQTWNVNFNGPNSISGNGFNINADAAGHSFSGQAGNGTTVYGTPSNRIEGNFYGPNANAVAGGFKIKSSDYYYASGVFKANKQ